MAIADRIAINGSGVIYYDSAAGAHDHTAATAEYYTVIQFHRFLQDLADDATASGDDLVDITSQTPTDRSTDNIITVLAPYTLDDGTVGGGDPVWEHLYDGSIIQASNGRTWDGLVVIAGEGMDLQILQNGALVANDFWNSVPSGETLKGLNRDVGNGISHRFMIETINASGQNIDGRRIIGMTRVNGKTHSEFRVNGTARGNNVLALTYVDDLNNPTDPATVATWSDIDNNSNGYVELDIDNNGAVEPYYSEWDKGSRTTNQLYERIKWLVACESGTTATTANATLYGLDGNIFRGITHSVAGTQAGGSFATTADADPGQGEAVSWATGTGQLLAANNTTAATALYIQLLTGTAPVNTQTITGGTSGATFTVSSSTEQTVSTPFCGSSTGSAIIGAYGFALETADTGPSDLYRDLTNTTNQPPNNVTFTVNGIVSGEDRVLVGPANGSALRTDQCQVAAGEAITVTGGSVSSATSGAGVVVLASNTETIGSGTSSASDTPAAGTLRIFDGSVYQIVNYTSRDTTVAGEITFSGCTATGTWSASAANDAFMSYIDLLAAAAFASYTVVYGSDRSLFIRVRDGGTAGDAEGIKTFETTGTLGSGGGSTTAIRTSDV